MFIQITGNYIWRFWERGNYFFTDQNMAYIYRIWRKLPDNDTQQSLLVIHVSGDNSRVNINSVDKSMNILNALNLDRFDEIEDVLRQIQDESKQTECMDSLNSLRESVGTSKYIEKYQQFIATAADHMTLISPYIVYLSSLLQS